MSQEIVPLKSLEAVLSWQSSSQTELARSSVELSHSFSRCRDTPKTLVCHDMAGGYLNDRFVGGCDGSGYRFYHWQYLDMFIYFSHHLVTIPPPCWTNTAHRHGVQVLGTFITEWNDGKQVCSEFLQSSRDYRSLANKMVEIMKYYGFDGWLINIENVIEEDKVSHLREFVAYLTQRCHSEMTGSKVIWYDSVTRSGELKWQDQLNEENKMFFDACDGIFLNYNWDETKLQNSYNIAGTKRVHDVFVGVDVFGRGCPGGGGYNSCEAMTKIRQANLSAAIFAQGWVYETLGAENFTKNEDRFWQLLHDYCSSSTFTSPLLCTSFCQGEGQKYFCKGEVAKDRPWYNLSLQQVQPTFNIQGQRSEGKNLELTTSDGYMGGGCLLLRGEVRREKEKLWFNLFQFDAPVSTVLYVTFTSKGVPDNIKPVLSLTLSKGGNSRVLCLGEEEAEEVVRKKLRTTVEEVWISPHEQDSRFNSWQNRNKWKTRCFRLEERLVCGWNLQGLSVGISADDKEQNIVCLYLGQIQILTEPPSSPSSSVQNLTCSCLKQEERDPGGDNLYSLQWEDAGYRYVQYYNVYQMAGDSVLVGQTLTPSCVLSLNSSCGSELCVQTVRRDGVVIPLTDCPSCHLPD
ncbi:cytosolic endo-beta-N-acetylglucosaminidase-like isoform X2 [Haliotis asinina]|uniref:cytosolic endo-beta-N-acetylglucosaminidase-like isoform X2 n=1 Tax=Haliotis asinina TaxID=109174 RepID=UPI00353230F4